MKEKRFNKTAYDNAYIARVYDRVNLTVPKGDKDKIKAHAEQYDGGSVNAFINRAIEEQMKRDQERQ